MSSRPSLGGFTRDKLARGELIQPKQVTLADDLAMKTAQDAISVRRTSLRLVRPTVSLKTVEYSPGKIQPEGRREEGKQPRQYGSKERKVFRLWDVQKAQPMLPKTAGKKKVLRQELVRSSSDQGGKETIESLCDSKNKASPVTVNTNRATSISNRRRNDEGREVLANSSDVHYRNVLSHAKHMPFLNNPNLFPAKSELVCSARLNQISSSVCGLCLYYTGSVNHIAETKFSPYEASKESLKKHQHQFKDIYNPSSSPNGLPNIYKNTNVLAPGIEVEPQEDHNRLLDTTVSGMASLQNTKHEAVAFDQSGIDPAPISGKTENVQDGQCTGAFSRKPKAGGQDFILKNIFSVKRSSTQRPAINRAQMTGHGVVNKTSRSEERPMKKNKQYTVNKFSISRIKSSSTVKKSPQPPARSPINDGVTLKSSRSNYRRQRNQDSSLKSVSNRPSCSGRGESIETDTLELLSQKRYDHSSLGDNKTSDYPEHLYMPASVDQESRTDAVKRYKKGIIKTRGLGYLPNCKIPVLKPRREDSVPVKIPQDAQKSRVSSTSSRKVSVVPSVIASQPQGDDHPGRTKVDVLRTKFKYAESRSAPVTGLSSKPFERMITSSFLEHFNTHDHASMATLLGPQTFVNKFPGNITDGKRSDYHHEESFKRTVSHRGKGLYAHGNDRCDRKLLVSKTIAQKTDNAAYSNSHTFHDFSKESETRVHDPYLNLTMSLNDSLPHSETGNRSRPHGEGTNSPGHPISHIEHHTHTPSACASSMLSHESRGEGKTSGCEGSFLGQIITELTEQIPLAIQQKKTANICSVSETDRPAVRDDYACVEQKKLASKNGNEQTPKGKNCGILGLQLNGPCCRKIRIKLSVTSTSNTTGFLDMEKEKGTDRETCTVTTPDRETVGAAICRRSNYSQYQTLCGKRYPNRALNQEIIAVNPFLLSPTSTMADSPVISLDDRWNVNCVPLDREQWHFKGAQTPSKRSNKGLDRSKHIEHTFLRHDSPPHKSRPDAKRRPNFVDSSSIAESEFESCKDEKWFTRQKQGLTCCKRDKGRNCARKILHRKRASRFRTRNIGHFFSLRLSWGIIFLTTLPVFLFFLSLHYFWRAKEQVQDFQDTQSDLSM